MSLRASITRYVVHGAMRGRWLLLGLRRRSRAIFARRDSADSGTRGDRLVVLVHSFDGYQRFWPPVMHFAGAALPEDLVIYFASEHQGQPNVRARNLLTGSGGFVERLERAVGELSTAHEYVLYLQEDMWLTEPVSAEMLDEFLQVMDEHQLDCLKLGWGSFWPDDRQKIDATTDPLPGAAGDRYRWFGSNPYAVSHHCSIFRVSFLLDTARLIRPFGVTSPIRHELSASAAISRQVKARNADRRPVRIAVWKTEPPIAYVHASEMGRLTEAARELLDARQLAHLYDEDRPGEVFPSER
jgi:hypothetical protein